MASTQVNPTRMELTRLKKKLATATRGHKLLKDKRDELMRQFLDLVRENMALRQKVEAGIRSANVNFVIAKAGMSEQALNTALAAPKQAVYLEADKKNVMSVDIPVFHYKTRTADENDIYSYGFAFTSSDLDGAVKSLADILPDMLRLSETEKACQLMAAEIAYASIISSSCRSLNFSNTRPHSYPEATSFTSSLKRFKDASGPSKICSPSRVIRALQPLWNLPSRT